MTSPIATALAALAGGASGYGRATHEEDQDQLNRAMDQLKLTEGLRRMGATPYDPNDQSARLNNLNLDPAKLAASIGNTPSTTDAAMGVLTAGGGGTTAPGASISQGRTPDTPGRFGTPFTINDPQTKRPVTYRTDETLSDTGRQERREDSKQQAEYNRQDALRREQQAYQRDNMSRANQGIFGTLSKTDYYPPGSTYESVGGNSRDLTEDWKDYQASKQNKVRADLAAAHERALLGGVSAQNRQDKLDEQEREGMAYMYDYPATSQEDVDAFNHQHDMLMKQGMSPGRAAYAIKQSRMGAAREGGLNATTAGKQQQNASMAQFSGGGAPAPGRGTTTPPASTVPPGADPEMYRKNPEYKKWVDSKVGGGTP